MEQLLCGLCLASHLEKNHNKQVGYSYLRATKAAISAAVTGLCGAGPLPRPRQAASGAGLAAASHGERSRGGADSLWDFSVEHTFSALNKARQMVVLVTDFK